LFYVPKKSGDAPPVFSVQKSGKKSKITTLWARTGGTRLLIGLNRIEQEVELFLS